MSESIKFAGKNDSNIVTPVSVSDEGHLRERRQFTTESTDIVNEVLNITETTYYPAFDARQSGMIAIVIWNRSGVPLTLQFYSILSNGTGTAVAPCRDAKDELPVFTIPSGHQVVITPEDLPMLNYAQYINVSLTPAGTPTGTSATFVRVLNKR